MLCVQILLILADKACSPGILPIMETNDTSAMVSSLQKSSKVTFDITNIIGLVVWMLCVFYSCMSSAVEISKIDSKNRGKLLVRIPFASKY